MDEIFFRLDISEAEYLRYYRGVAQVVVVMAHDGRRVQFPASNLRQFVTRTGVNGNFVMRFGPRRKLIEMKRLS